MTKKTGRLILGVLLLVMLVSCKQTSGDVPLPVCAPDPKPEAGTIIVIDWLQFKVYQSDYLHNDYYTRDLMIYDFMCDNRAIQTKAMAEEIIRNYPDNWTVPAAP